MIISILSRSDSQQYAAIYFASLRISSDVITMEWHSLHVKCTGYHAADTPGTFHPGGKKGRVSVRLYFSEKEWARANKVWNSGEAQYGPYNPAKSAQVRLLKVHELVEHKIITAAQSDMHQVHTTLALPSTSDRLISTMRHAGRRDGRAARGNGVARCSLVFGDALAL